MISNMLQTPVDTTLQRGLVPFYSTVLHWVKTWSICDHQRVHYALHSVHCTLHCELYTVHYTMGLIGKNFNLKSVPSCSSSSSTVRCSMLYGELRDRTVLG